jgi:hypothetical protein
MPLLVPGWRLPLARLGELWPVSSRRAGSAATILAPVTGDAVELAVDEAEGNPPFWPRVKLRLWLLVFRLGRDQDANEIAVSDGLHVPPVPWPAWRARQQARRRLR